MLNEFKYKRPFNDFIERFLRGDGKTYLLHYVTRQPEKLGNLHKNNGSKTNWQEISIRGILCFNKKFTVLICPILHKYKYKIVVAVEYWYLMCYQKQQMLPDKRQLQYIIS